MKSFIVYLCFFLCIFKLNAQTLSTTELVGTWKVISLKFLENSKKSDTVKLKKAKKALENALFIFAENKSFSLQSSKKDFTISNAFWHFKAKLESIVVYSQKSNINESILIQIEAKKNNEETIFRIDETPLLLIVEKEN